MGGKPTDGGPGPVVKDGQVLEWSRPASRVRPSCWRCDDTGYVETRKHFPASKYQPEGTLISSVRCTHCDAATRRDGAP